MKILYYTDQTYLHGGIERVLSNKINYFQQIEAIDIILVTTEQKNKLHCYKMPKNLEHYDLKININRSKSYFSLANILKLPKHFIKLRKILKQLNPDIIIVPNYDYAFYFLPFIHRKSKKIKEFHSSRYYESITRKKSNSLLKKIFYQLNDFIESKYDYLVLLTPEEKQHYNSDNTIVIPNGINIESNTLCNTQSKKVISAGRIAPVKGFDKLISTWLIVSKEHPDWQLNIYGNGEKEDIDKLQRQIDKLSLQKQILLRGQTDDLIDKMLESSIYVMSSKTECFPMVLLEAQTVGLPIISFDCPYGPRNIINHNQNGILVDNQNINQLAEAIITLINSEKLRNELSENSVNSSKVFRQEKITKIWLTLFNKLK